jgi:hypothetical protein
MTKNYLKGYEANKNVRTTRCIYCKKDVTTASDIPICSRKSCKKQHPNSQDGMPRIIVYTEKTIERDLQ